MGIRREDAVLCCVVLFNLWTFAITLLSPKGYNFEVEALMVIKYSLEDPHGVLDNWDAGAVDPCSFTMVTCSPDSLVIGLKTSSQSLSGTLSPFIGNLTNLQLLLLQNSNISGPIPSELGRLPKLNTLDLSYNFFTGEIPTSLAHLKTLQYLLLHNNNISGPIPSELGRLSKLHTLDLSNNFFTSEIPTSLAHLKSLQYIMLNNNSLYGEIPSSLANMPHLAFLDLSYNNLSGHVPRLSAETFNIIGNPLICATGTEQDCYGTQPTPLPSTSINSQDSQLSGREVALSFGVSLVSICLLLSGFECRLQWRRRSSH